MKINTDDIKFGFATLIDLVEGRSQKIRRNGEFAALKTLAILNSQYELEPALQEQRTRLYSVIENMNRDTVADLVNQLRPDPLPCKYTFRLRRRREARLFLLFILLVRVIAPVSRFVVIPVLGEMHRYPANAEIDFILDWIPRFWIMSSNANLALSYLNLTQEVWGAGNIRPGVSDFARNLDTLKGHSWQRQIVEIKSWRADWNAEAAATVVHADNPICRSDSIEFWLAHSHYYRTLRRAGRAIARTSLTELGYCDAGVKPKNGIVTAIVLCVLFSTASILLYRASQSLALNWVKSTREFTDAIDRRLLDYERLLPATRTDGTVEPSSPPEAINVEE